MKYLLTFLFSLFSIQLSAVDVYPPLPPCSNQDLVYIRVCVPAYYDTLGTFHPSTTEWIASTPDIDVEKDQTMPDGCFIELVFVYIGDSAWEGLSTWHGSGYKKEVHRYSWWDGHDHPFLSHEKEEVSPKPQPMHPQHKMKGH